MASSAYIGTNEPLSSHSSITLASESSKRTVADEEGDAAHNTKRPRIIDGKQRNGRQRHTSVMASSEVPDLDGEAPLNKPIPGRITASTFEDIRRFTLEGEDLGWTKVTDKKKRAQIQKVISKRKSDARRKAERQRTTEKGIKRMAQQWLEGPSVSTDAHGNSCPLPVPAAVQETVSKMIPEPVYHKGSDRLVSPFSLADIIKYSKEGEDLDWTKASEKKQRARMQSIISTCEMKDPEGLRWKRWGSAADAEDLNESGDGVDGETEAESGESAFSTTGRVVYPQTLQDIAKYQQEGEDFAWHNEPDPERCKETQSLILRRKHQGPDTTRYFKPDLSRFGGNRALPTPFLERRAKEQAAGSMTTTRTWSRTDDGADLDEEDTHRSAAETDDGAEMADSLSDAPPAEGPFDYPPSKPELYHDGLADENLLQR